MKYNAAQLEAIAQGKPMEVIMALADAVDTLASGTTPEDKTVDTTVATTEEGEGLAAATARLTELESQNVALTEQLAQVQAAHDGMLAALETAQASAKAAEDVAKALRAPIEAQVKQYAVALNQMVDPAAMDAGALAAKHVELAESIKKNFRPGGVSQSAVKVDKSEPKQSVQDQQILAAARSFKIAGA